VRRPRCQGARRSRSCVWRVRRARGSRRDRRGARFVCRICRAWSAGDGAGGLHGHGERAARDPRGALEVFVLGVARHPVRVNWPLGSRGILPHVVDVHTRPRFADRGGSAHRWMGTVPNPG
jgi:hypothetical protein